MRGDCAFRKVTCVGTAPADKSYVCGDCTRREKSHAWGLLLLTKVTCVGTVPAERSHMRGDCTCLQKSHVWGLHLLTSRMCGDCTG
jgi:hypothetical protein